MRRAAAAAIAAAAVAAAGCGTPSPDLFVMTRTGSIPGARLTLRVDDGGQVSCNGGPKRELGSDRLLTARQLVRDFEPAARSSAVLAQGPNGVLSYRFRLEAGTVAFGDTSRGQSPVMRRSQAFVRDVAKRVCGLVR
jgi:hypothetical protein